MMKTSIIHLDTKKTSYTVEKPILFVLNSTGKQVKPVEVVEDEDVEVLPCSFDCAEDKRIKPTKISNVVVGGSDEKSSGGKKSNKKKKKGEHSSEEDEEETATGTATPTPTKKGEKPSKKQKESEKSKKKEGKNGQKKPEPVKKKEELTKNPQIPIPTTPSLYLIGAPGSAGEGQCLQCQLIMVPAPGQTCPPCPPCPPCKCK